MKAHQIRERDLTLLTISGLNGFGSAGFYIEITLMKTILPCFFCNVVFCHFADKRPIPIGGQWHLVNRQRFHLSGIAIVYVDLSGGGFLATDIVDSFRLFTGIEKYPC